MVLCFCAFLPAFCRFQNLSPSKPPPGSRLSFDEITTIASHSILTFPPPSILSSNHLFPAPPPRLSTARFPANPFALPLLPLCGLVPVVRLGRFSAFRTHSFAFVCSAEYCSASGGAPLRLLYTRDSITLLVAITFSLSLSGFITNSLFYFTLSKDPERSMCGTSPATCH